MTDLTGLHFLSDQTFYSMQICKIEPIILLLYRLQVMHSVSQKVTMCYTYYVEPWSHLGPLDGTVI